MVFLNSAQGEKAFRKHTRGIGAHELKTKGPRDIAHACIKEGLDFLYNLRGKIRVLTGKTGKTNSVELVPSAILIETCLHVEEG